MVSSSWPLASHTLIPGAVADWSCTIQIPQEHAEKLLSGWKKIWYQQLRTQVSRSEVETEAIESAAASTANNYAEAKRLSRVLTRLTPSYTEREEQGIEQWVARFRPGRSQDRGPPEGTRGCTAKFPADHPWRQMSVHEDYWPFDSQEKLDEAIADSKSYWISQGNKPQAYTDEQWGNFLKKKLKETKQRARE